MANRLTCYVCRSRSPMERMLWLPAHCMLCPEHKRRRNRLLRLRAAAARCEALALRLLEEVPPLPPWRSAGA